VSKCTYNAVMNLFNPSCVSNQMYMAASEMVQVVSPDLPTIHDHISKLLFYYGATDHWCPVSYYHKMKLQFPDADIKLCEKGIAHAFCLESSAETAVMVWGWIQEDVSKIYQ
ncbi:lipid droplet-associated hydrolase-like, partial [Saccoglossus kowalevskii]